MCNGTYVHIKALIPFTAVRFCSKRCLNESHRVSLRHTQSIRTFYPLNNLIDRLPQRVRRGDRFMPDRVLPGFAIEAASSIDVNIEFEPDVMIKARKNHAI